MDCCGDPGGSGCSAGCVCFVPSENNKLVCDCGHRKIRHKPGPSYTAEAQLSEISSKLASLETGVSSELAAVSSKLAAVSSNFASLETSMTKVKDGLMMVVDEALDPWAGIRTSDGSTDVGSSRKQTILTYYKINANICMITGPGDSKLIKNARVWPDHTKGKGLVFFDLEQVMVGSPRNFLRLNNEIERAFDRHQLILVPQLTAMPHSTSFNLRVRVLDPDLKASTEAIKITQDRYVKWSELDGIFSYWEFGKTNVKGERVPFTRLLAHHHLISLKYASEKEWIEPRDLGELKDRALRVLRHYLDDATVDKLARVYNYERNI